MTQNYFAFDKTSSQGDALLPRCVALRGRRVNALYDKIFLWVGSRGFPNSFDAPNQQQSHNDFIVTLMINLAGEPLVFDLMFPSQPPILDYNGT